MLLNLYHQTLNGQPCSSVAIYNIVSYSYMSCIQPMRAMLLCHYQVAVTITYNYTEIQGASMMNSNESVVFYFQLVFCSVVTPSPTPIQQQQALLVYLGVAPCKWLVSEEVKREWAVKRDDNRTATLHSNTWLGCIQCMCVCYTLSHLTGFITRYRLCCMHLL